MRVDRRTLIATLGGIATTATAGCTGGSDEAGTGTESGEWTQIDPNTDVEYRFPQGEQTSYESNPPAEVQNVDAYQRGVVVEARGSFTVSEALHQVVRVQAQFRRDGEIIAQPDKTVERPEPDQTHRFSFIVRLTNSERIDNLKIVVARVGS